MEENKRKIREFGKAIDTEIFGIKMSFMPLRKMDFSYNLDYFNDDNVKTFLSSLLNFPPYAPPLSEQMQENFVMALNLASADNESDDNKEYLCAIIRELTELIDDFCKTNKSGQENFNLKFYIEFFEKLELLPKEHFDKWNLQRNGRKQ
ncbi:hypothetical protein niasHS_007663 [Heterodera schachtii]|uniref:Uncharacterized protein n=1 Tax=Heterodera schachtii TaxID=97005 RepID=A0ABD2JPR0_HETSC